MTKAALDIQFSSLTPLKAALISIKKATQLTTAVQILLLERLAIHPGAVQRWRMGWLTEKYPEEEMRLFVASRTSADEAARNIARRIARYSKRIHLKH